MHRQPQLALSLGTAAFAVSFLVWGLMAPLAPQFQAQYGLTNTQVSILIAAPVLLGSVGRIPIGLLTDRWGGRRVFSALLVAQTVPLILAGAADGYGSLLLAAVFLGLAGAAFAVGVPFVSRWYPPQRQGLALGIYGAGNIGTALAALLATRLAAAFGTPWAFWALVPAVVVMAALFYGLGTDAPGPRPAGSGLVAALAAPRAWMLSICYFVTFGGFVAFGGYLTKLYVDVFALPRTDAAAGAALFVLVATAARPLGGWLADRVGGRAGLAAAFAAIAGAAVLLSLAPPLPWFRWVVLLLGAGFGLGNGAVFKLVPQLFPGRTGAVTGLVGAMGGLGGFFPPLLMGLFRDRLGTYTPGFTLLAAAAAAAWLLVPALSPPPAPWRLPRTDEAAARLERLFLERATAGAILVVGGLALAVYLGSGRLLHFDPALYGYAVATLVATFGLVLRVTAWLMRPATRRLLTRLVQLAGRRVVRLAQTPLPVPAGVGARRSGVPHPGGWVEAVRRQQERARRVAATPGGDPGLAPERRGGSEPQRGGGAAAAKAPPQRGDPGTAAQQPGPPAAGRPGLRAAWAMTVRHLLLNRFIFRRTGWRGLQHFLLMWGVIGSFAITLPLVFGWFRFDAVDEARYRVVLLGLPLFTMPVQGWLSGLFYHALSFFAVLTLAGTAMALVRRLWRKEARVDQRVEYDLFPLYLLLAVTVSGLALTVSHTWLAGASYPLLALSHQLTVVGLLLYLPFGKLWHVPLRVGNVATAVYHEVGAHLGEQPCVRCRKLYATRLQVRDVTEVLAETGLHLLAPDGRTYLHEYCPECRRVLRGLLYSRRQPRPGELGAEQPLVTPAQLPQAPGSVPPHLRA